MRLACGMTLSDTTIPNFPYPICTWNGRQALVPQPAWQARCRAPVGSSEGFEYDRVLFFTCQSQDLPLSLPRPEFTRTITLAWVEEKRTEDKKASKGVG